MRVDVVYHLLLERQVALLASLNPLKLCDRFLSPTQNKLLR